MSVENLESTIKVATEYYCQENVTIDGNIVIISSFIIFIFFIHLIIDKTNRLLYRNYFSGFRVILEGQ